MNTRQTTDPVLSGLESELDRLWGFAMHLTGNRDDAADLVQRTCVRAIEQRERFDPERPLRNWLYRLAKNLWLNEVRSRDVAARHVSRSAAEHDAESHAHAHTDSSPETRTHFAEVEQAVAALPEAQRHVLILVAVEGLSYREAADVLEIPIGTVMSRLARARLTVGKRFLNASEKHLNTHRRAKVTSLHGRRAYRQDAQS